MATDVEQVNKATDIYDEAAHALPGFINWLINNVLLILLLSAEGYLMGSLFARGWVDNIESPNNWGTYHGVGVVLFFCGGAATAGLGLRSSVAAAGFFQRKKWGFAFFNLLIVLTLTLAEVWSSFAERSFHLVSSPADKALLTALGFPANSVITPTLMVVAFILPFASLSFGFSQQRKARVTQADVVDEETDLDRQIMRAEKQARLNEIRAAGARKAFQAARGKQEEERQPVPLGANGHRRS